MTSSWCLRDFVFKGREAPFDKTEGQGATVHNTGQRHNTGHRRRETDIQSALQKAERKTLGGETNKQKVLLGEMVGRFQQHAVCSQVGRKEEQSHPSLRPDPTPAGSNTKGLLS